MSAGMGIFQEQLYKKHGKHPQEALYYTVRYFHMCKLVILHFSNISYEQESLHFFFTAFISIAWVSHVF